MMKCKCDICRGIAVLDEVVEFPQSQARASEVIRFTGNPYETRKVKQKSLRTTKTGEIRFSRNDTVNGNNRSHVSSSYSVD
jgi:hypothetical protein